ncbi:MAG TPA: helix-turn-helix domain-containing protein [Candidatus Glassbacteria bacterium]|nr:helix-turn-helix domain-containing protein [Candidatus Glassbacteria bacterium]
MKYKNIKRNIYKGAGWYICMRNETIFVEVFGSNPIIKVLDFLITFQAFDYPLTEIAKNSGVSYSTLQTFWDRLERNNIVIKTRRVGKSDLYKLNTKNPAVQQLIKLDWNLIKGLEKEIPA